MAEVDKINEENEQVIYDALFMSEPEFCMVYGEIYRAYVKEELKDMFQRIRDNVIENGGKFNRKLTKTRISHESPGGVRKNQQSEKMDREIPKEKLEEEEEPVKPKRKGSLKEDILKLHKEGKTKSQIRDEVGCKYQYVYQTVKKYEKAKEVDS